MKKIAFFMMALAALALSISFTACGNPNTPNNPGDENDTTQTGGGASIEYVDHESNPIVVNSMDEKTLDIFGGSEFMLQNYSPEEETMIAIFKNGAGLLTKADDYHDNLVAVNEGDLIDASAHWTMGSSDVEFCTLYENSAYGVYTDWSAFTGYVGVCNQAADGTHYGWIKMTVVVSNSGDVTVTVYSWAYEKTPNTPIKAGRKA